MRAVFFCEKFSDLEHMMPFIYFAMGERQIKRVFVIWYGDLLSDQSIWLVNAIVEKSSDKCQIFIPGVFRMRRYIPGKTNWSLSSKSIKFAIRLIQRVARLSSRFDAYHPFMSKQIETTIASEQGPDTINFFGFFDRATIRKIAQKYTSGVWVRIPQGAIVTQSVYRTSDSVLTPNMSPVSRYLPDYADFGFTTDLIVNEHYLSMGFEPDSIQPAPIGSLRYSAHFIRELDDICKTYPPAENRSEKPTILFLLTPFHKNVWREELENSISIILSYDVDLVVKGFHSNTTLAAPKVDNFSIDETTPTPVLTRRADYIFYIATSAVIEPLVAEKKVVQLSYLHCNQLHFEALGLGMRLNSRDELHKAMQNITEHGYVNSEASDDHDTRGIREWLLTNLVREDSEKVFLRKVLSAVKLKLGVVQ